MGEILETLVSNSDKLPSMDMAYDLGKGYDKHRLTQAYLIINVKTLDCLLEPGIFNS